MNTKIITSIGLILNKCIVILMIAMFILIPSAIYSQKPLSSPLEVTISKEDNRYNHDYNFSTSHRHVKLTHLLEDFSHFSHNRRQRCIRTTKRSVLFHS